MKKPTLGDRVIYAGGNVTEALRAAEKAGAPIAMDDLMAARLSVQRPYPATVTRVIDDVTVDLELIGLPADQPRPRFGVKFSAKGEPGTFNFEEVKGASGATSSEETDLEKLTVAELTDLAAERNIEIPSGAKKAEIIELLNA